MCRKEGWIGDGCAWEMWEGEESVCMCDTVRIRTSELVCVCACACVIEPSHFMSCDIHDIVRMVTEGHVWGKGNSMSGISTMPFWWRLGIQWRYNITKDSWPIDPGCTWLQIATYISLLQTHHIWAFAELVSVQHDLVYILYMTYAQAQSKSSVNTAPCMCKTTACVYHCKKNTEE